MYAQGNNNNLANTQALAKGYMERPRAQHEVNLPKIHFKWSILRTRKRFYCGVISNKHKPLTKQYTKLSA